MLFIHAFSGCDTTSRMFRVGKKSEVQKVITGDSVLNVLRCCVHRRLIQLLWKQQVMRPWCPCSIEATRFKTIEIKEGLYSIWCGVNRFADTGVHTLVETSAFVSPAGQLLLTRRGKTRMDGVCIVFEFYIAPLYIVK